MAYVPPGGGQYAEMAIRSLPHGGYVVYAAPPYGMGDRAVFTEFLAAFSELPGALAFVGETILHPREGQDAAAPADKAA